MTHSAVYALLADGTTVEIRPAGPGDFDAVKAMHQAMSPDNTYLRFFNVSRLAAETEARRIARDPAPGQAALLALTGSPGTGRRTVAGVASYVALREDPEQAEVAFAVADDMHHRGIATLLLEHLVSYARSHRITTFVAETLTENKAMLGVFADAGLPVKRRYAEGVYRLTFPLPSPEADPLGPTLDGYLSAVAARERRADAASLRHVFAPESVAVIGASRRHGAVGRAILDNIRAAGYAGRLYTVNPHAAPIDGPIDGQPDGHPGGERGLAAVTDLPPVDLAVVAVPAAGVLEVAEQCGQRGVRSLVVITAGVSAGDQATLLATCRRHGMRLIGPDCFGVAVPGLGLDATFAARPARPGVAGLVMQSGGLGFAAVDHLSRLGIGISSFASVGDKLDVSSNDMLLWWEQDGVTRLAVLYIESFGNPRKFARTARRVSATMPVLTVLADRSDAQTREALFDQAGVVTTRGFGELIQATALLATQPVPAGRTVAIVSNVGSAGTLAADACADLGLTVHSVTDTTAPVTADDFRRCLEQQAADDDVHALVAIALPTGATGDLAAAITAADTRGRPIAAVVLTQPESVRMLPAQDQGPGQDQGQGQDQDRKIPAYGTPEIAVRALARAAGYGAWRAEPRGHVPDFPDIETTEARALVRDALEPGAREPGGREPGALTPDQGWLGPGETARLLRYYGLPLADLPPAGPELTVRVTDDHMFGTLVTLGRRETPSPAWPARPADRDAARLTPLTDRDAAQLIAAAGLAGRVPSGPLANLLLRVGRLADELPEVTELELSPVIAGPDGATVVDARIRVSPYQPQDPFLRKLR